MKIQELFEAKADFRKIQKEIYDFVVSKLKTKSETISYIKDLIKTTDQFWVHDFDNVLEAIERENSLYHIEDMIWNAIVSVSESISEYFSNPLNHPPGCKPIKIPEITEGMVKRAELAALIEKIAPGLAKKYADEERAEKERHKALSAEEIKSITKERLTSIASFIKKHDALLLEHYVNLITPSEKEKYVDQVWDLLQDAYKEIGGFKSVTSKEDLIHGTYLWKLVRRAGKIVTVMIYKNQHGRKLIGLATDQSRQGKTDLAKIAQDDHQLRRSWAEVSGKAETLIVKIGGKPLSHKLAKQLTGKEILGYDVDGIHYSRLIGGELKHKAIYGFPKLSAEQEELLKKNEIQVKS